MVDFITVDFDAILRNPIDKAFFMVRLKYICSIFKCEIYATRKGLHVYIVSEKKLDFYTKLFIRSYLLDDPMRIEFDLLRYQIGLDKWIDTLFLTKREENQVKYIEEKISIEELEKILFVKYSPLYVH